MSVDIYPLAVELRHKQLEREVEEMRAFQRATPRKKATKSPLAARRASPLRRTLWSLWIRPATWSKN